MLSIFSGKGDGTFVAPTTLLSGVTAPAWQLYGVVITDLDGDGFNDLLTTTEYGQNTAQVFLHDSQVVPPTLQTATDISANASVVPAGTPITFTVTETAFSGQPAGSVDLYDTVLFPPYSVLATLPLVGNTATYTTSSLSVGYHEIEAIFHGNSVYAPSQSAGQLIQILESHAAIIALTAAPNPASFGQTVTLRATLTGSYGTPTGTVTFLDGGQNLGMATLSGGVATFTTSTFAVGTHTIQVGYTGNYPSQTSTSITVNVQSESTAAQLSVSPNPAQYGSPVAVAFAVTAGGGPTGTVKLLDGIATLATLPLDATGIASTSLSTLSPGVHTLSGVYSGDPTHGAATSNSVSLAISNGPTTTSLSATPQKAFAFQPIQLQGGANSAVAVSPTLPTGTLAIAANNQRLVNGSLDAHGMVTGTSTLAAGTYSLLASYAGDLYFSASASAALSLIVSPDTTTTSLQLSSGSSLQQQTVTFTVGVTAGHSSAAPAGTVSLSEGGTLIASGPVNAQGTFSAQLSSLGPGTHSLVAVYSGSANFQGSSSAPVSLVVSAADYGLTTSVSQITIQTEHHAPLNVAVAAFGGLADTVTLGCSQLPAHSTCTFQQKALALSAAGTSTQLMLDTDDVLYYAGRRDPAQPGQATSAHTLLWLAALLPLGLLARGRRLPRSLLLAVSLGTLLGLSGCSGKFPDHTAPGTYTFNVVSKGVQSGISHQVAVTLIVTP